MVINRYVWRHLSLAAYYGSAGHTAFIIGRWFRAAESPAGLGAYAHHPHI